MAKRYRSSSKNSRSKKSSNNNQATVLIVGGVLLLAVVGLLLANGQNKKRSHSVSKKPIEEVAEPAPKPEPEPQPAPAPEPQPAPAPEPAPEPVPEESGFALSFSDEDAVAKGFKTSDIPMSYLDKREHITSPFGWRTYDKKMHRGVDLGMKIGTELGAVRGGEGWTATYKPNCGSGGNGVFLTNGQEMFIYFHLSDMSQTAPGLGYVQENGKWTLHNVQFGQVIAISGNTGKSGGPHCHLRYYRIVNGKEDDECAFVISNEKNGFAPEFYDTPNEGGHATSDTSVRLPKIRLRVKSWDLRNVDITLIKVDGRDESKHVRNITVKEGYVLIHDGGGRWSMNDVDLRNLPAASSWTFKLTASTYSDKTAEHIITVKK